ncbi:MAG: hypothetical protein LBK59_02990 [Bifidobacteriaceae bacterium]|jgi:hypothetical protein|nr:hypothetical protein [Bifidobacteriaceae bacterium]
MSARSDRGRRWRWMAIVMAIPAAVSLQLMITSVAHSDDDVVVRVSVSPWDEPSGGSESEAPSFAPASTAPASVPPATGPRTDAASGPVRTTLGPGLGPGDGELPWTGAAIGGTLLVAIGLTVVGACLRARRINP